MRRFPFYRVNPKNNRAYWIPTKSMKAAGFASIALGLDGPEARELAAEWTAKWTAERRRRKARAGCKLEYVYFVLVRDRMKIGYSQKPLARVSKISGGAHDAITSAVIVRGTKSDEKRLHERFNAYRTNGEWFVAARVLRLSMVRSAMVGAVVHDGSPASERPELEAA